MFDLDLNIVMTAVAFCTIALAYGLVSRLEKRNNVLERRTSLHRIRMNDAKLECANARHKLKQHLEDAAPGYSLLQLKLNSATDERNKARDKADAFEHANQRLSGRINNAIKRGLDKPNSRPNRILDILMGLDDDLCSPLGEPDIAPSSYATMNIDGEERRFFITNPEDIAKADDPDDFDTLVEVAEKHKKFNEIIANMPPMTPRPEGKPSLYEKLQQGYKEQAKTIRIMNTDGTTEHVPIGPGATLDPEWMKRSLARYPTTPDAKMGMIMGEPAILSPQADARRKAQADANLLMSDQVEAALKQAPALTRADLLKTEVFIKFAAMNGESIEEYVDKHFPNALAGSPDAADSIAYAFNPGQLAADYRKAELAMLAIPTFDPKKTDYKDGTIVRFVNAGKLNGLRKLNGVLWEKWLPKREPLSAAMWEDMRAKFKRDIEGTIPTAKAVAEGIIKSARDAPQPPNSVNPFVAVYNALKGLRP